MPFSSLVSDVLAAGSSGGSSGGGGGGGILSFLPLVLIVFVGYLLLVRPARNRQRKALENRAALEPGAEVTTTAGLIATVISVDDDVVTLEIAPGVQSRFIKGAIARVHTTYEPESEEMPAHEDIPPEDGGPTAADTPGEPAAWEKRDQDPDRPLT